MTGREAKLNYEQRNLFKFATFERIAAVKVLLKTLANSDKVSLMTTI
jgi:hypothetical protein